MEESVPMGGRVHKLLGLVALPAAFLLPSAGAQAATVQLGPDLSVGGFNVGPYGNAVTVANSPSANGASPVDGTVVSWSVIGASTNPFIPRIIRPAGPGLYQSVASGPNVAITPAPAVSGPFSVSLPIKAGDLFGISFVTSSDLWFKPSTGASGFGWNPQLADGAAPRPPSFALTNEQEAISATVRYCIVPAVKRKSPKAARAALAAADCAVGKVKMTKRERKRKQVLSQSVEPGTSISDTAPIDLKLARKR